MFPVSRKVDPNSKSLSNDDKLYLIQRGLLPTSVMSAEEQRKLVDPDQSSLSLEDRANTGDVNTANLTVDQLEQMLEEARARDAAVDTTALMKPAGAAAAAADEEDEEELTPPYDQYSKAQLIAELQNRNENRAEDDQWLLSGNKDELIARLEEDDSEDDEEE
jgi:hypothetical protein